MQDIVLRHYLRLEALVFSERNLQFDYHNVLQIWKEYLNTPSLLADQHAIVCLTWRKSLTYIQDLVPLTLVYWKLITGYFGKQ